MKKSNLAATISVNWGYEEHSITLTPRNWTAIKAGRAHSQRGAGYHYEGEFFWDYWSFAGNLDGQLEVGYGGDGGQGFVGKLSDATIEEHEYQPKGRKPCASNGGAPRGRVDEVVSLLGGAELSSLMRLDPKLEKKIDSIYHNTRRMPLYTILGIFFPIVWLILGPIGLFYWFWRRGLLEAADSGKLPVDAARPPLPSPGRAAQLSSAAKLDYIRSHKHTLLLPLFILAGIALMFSALFGYFVIINPRP